MTLRRKVSAILVAGGQGSRMKTTTPKQFLTIKDKPVVKYSFDILMSMPEIAEVVVVCDPKYRHIFEQINPDIKLSFANPGSQRQDSVYNGLQAIAFNSELICIHDAARPLITQNLVSKVLQAANEHGAATAGMPLKFTVKEHNGNEFVKTTLDRSLIWEIQTPQVIKIDLIKQGFKNIQQNNLTVTDDVSVIELLNLPVKLVQGSYSNLKITTPEDLALAEYLLNQENCE